MSTLFPSESCKESQLSACNPQSWLQVERGKFSKTTSPSSSSSSSISSLFKVPDPPILPFFKPIDYVEVLAQIHEELESCSLQERSNLYLLQFQVFKGLGEVKLMRRSLRLAWQKASSVHDKIIFGAWLKYEKQGEELIADLLATCGKCAEEFGPIDISAMFHVDITTSKVYHENDMAVENRMSKNVIFEIGNEKIVCDRQKFACLSAPFYAMLNGSFSESLCDNINLSENNISAAAFRAISRFSKTGSLNESHPSLLMEILVFANKFCCEILKDACDRKLAFLVSSREDAIELMEYAIEENAPVLAASCLQVFLHELPDCLNDDRVVKIFSHATQQQRSVMLGSSSFSLYSLLCEVAINHDPLLVKTTVFLEQLLQSAETNQQRLLAFHKLGCLKLMKKDYDEAEKLFEAAISLGHTYSVTGLARLSCIKGKKRRAYEKLSSVISSFDPQAWMYLESSFCGSDSNKWEDLEKASELDPTHTYPYMYRAASLMKNQKPQAALVEINRILGFKLALECLELRFCFYLYLEDYQAALCDVQAILTLSPNYRTFEGRVAASQLRTLVGEHVENWNAADCWIQLYDRWSSVDDIGSLSVIYQMLESDTPKGVLYFRQSLLLLRLNCPEAAMQSLQLARQHSSSEHERLVYEGWILALFVFVFIQ